MKWSVPEIWKDGEVWIIGGGASVPRLFGVSEEVTEKVRNGALPISTYSSYMKDLWNKRVIGVNMAYALGNWLDMNFFGDVHFFLPNEEGIRNHPGIPITCHSQFSDDKRIRYLATDDRTWGISEYRDRVCWNWNSGAAAISVAVHTGAKRVLLLGFDMKLNNGATHWHGEYKKIGVSTDLPHIQAVFDRHLEAWPVVAEDAKRMKVEILNVNFDSAIDPKLIPMVRLEDVL